MVSVGGLAALVNVIVLLLVGIADRFLSITVRNFVATRLHQQRSAPVVHDSDTWLPNVPRSLIKFRRNPLILLAIICGVLLIAAEIVTEIGVDVSDRCSVVAQLGRVIPPGNVIDRVTDIELGASAMVVNRMRFVDTLDRVPAGVPKLLEGSECFSCMQDKSKFPDIVSGCDVAPVTTYRAGELDVTVSRHAEGPFGSVTDYFTEVGGERRRFFGMGDITGNGQHRASFVFHDDTQPGQAPALLYFEYAFQTHVEHLYQQTRDDSKGPLITEPIQRDVTAYRVSCDVNVIAAVNFLEIVMIYRMIQLESQMDLARFDQTQHRFQLLSKDDVMRAVLSAKVMDDDGNGTPAEFFRFTTCGKYKWKYIIPFSSCLLAVLLLSLISVSSKYGRGAFSRRVPYNSRSWFQRSLAVETEKDPLWLIEAKPTYFDEPDEMVLIEEGIGVPHERIVLRSAMDVHRAQQMEDAFRTF